MLLPWSHSHQAIIQMIRLLFIIIFYYYQYYYTDRYSGSQPFTYLGTIESTTFGFNIICFSTSKFFSLITALFWFEAIGAMWTSVCIYS